MLIEKLVRVQIVIRLMILENTKSCLMTELSLKRNLKQRKKNY